MSETVIRSNGDTFFPSNKAPVHFTPGWPGYIDRRHPPARPHSTETAHAEIGHLLSPLNFLAQFGRLDFSAGQLPYNELFLSLLNTEHAICEWKDDWLPKFRDVHVLPVEVAGREFPSYHDAVCGIGSQFASCVRRKFNAPNLGETSWDAYFAAVAANVVRRWGEIVRFLWVDSIFVQVDWPTLTEAFQDEGRRAVEYERREDGYDTVSHKWTGTITRAELETLTGLNGGSETPTAFGDVGDKLENFKDPFPDNQVERDLCKALLQAVGPRGTQAKIIRDFARKSVGHATPKEVDRLKKVWQRFRERVDKRSGDVGDRAPIVPKRQ